MKAQSRALVSPVCATEHTSMIVPWNKNRSLLPADELFSVLKKRRQCELPVTTDFDAPLRTQTIITDKVYSSLLLPYLID